MASGISGAGNLQDNVDYSIPHRPPPAPPSVASTASPTRSPELSQQHHFQHHGQGHQRQKSSGSGSILKSRPRKNSLGGLWRGGSSRRAQTPEAVAFNDSLTAPPLPPPPFPAPPIPHDDPSKHFHFGEAATVTSTAYSTPQNQAPPSHSFDEPEQERTSTSIFRSRSRSLSRSKSREGKSNMLRKSSKVKQQQAEMERQQREAQMLPKQPPRLPSHNPLPGMPSFGGEDARPDSIAMFNHKPQSYGRNAPQTAPGQAQTPVQAAANFSRPGNVGIAPAQTDNSSSPAYALRGASASVSPPPAVTTTDNGYDATERTGSMTNRGRYDYTATAAQAGHVNSPRRMRRRKDPTPFK